MSVPQVEHNAKLHMIFPTVVLRGHIARDFTEEEKNVVRHHANHVRENGGNHQSCDTYILNDPKMASVKEVCMAHIQAYIDQVFRPATEVRPYITQSWFTYYNKGGYINPHHHSNSVISGVIYFQAEEGVDSCSFLDTRYTPLLIPATHYDEVNSVDGDGSGDGATVGEGSGDGVGLVSGVGLGVGVGDGDGCDSCWLSDGLGLGVDVGSGCGEGLVLGSEDGAGVGVGVGVEVGVIVFVGVLVLVG